MKTVSVSTDLVAIAPNGAPMDVRFSYTSDDPFAVHMRIGGVRGPLWTFSRDLLAVGILVGDGVGDVVIKPVADGIRITLYPGGDREMSFLFDHDDLMDALLMTQDVVARGNEVIDFDAEIGKIAARHD